MKVDTDALQPAWMIRAHLSWPNIFKDCLQTLYSLGLALRQAFNCQLKGILRTSYPNFLLISSLFIYSLRF